MNLFTVFEEVVAKNRNNLAINYMDKCKYSYSEILDKVNAFAITLTSCGIEQNDRVILNSENNEHWHIAFLAITKIGAVPVLIDPVLPKNELDRLYIQSEAKLAIVSENCLEKISVEISIINISNFQITKLVEAEFAKQKEGNVVAIFYSSGTTSTAKGVVVLFDGLYTILKESIKIYSVNNNDRFIQILPSYHIYGFMSSFLSICGGAQQYFVSDVNKISSIMASFRPTIFFTVPKFLEMLKNKINKNVKESKKEKAFNFLIKVNKIFLKTLNINLGKFLFKKIHKNLGGSLKLLASGGSKLDTDVSIFMESIGVNIAIGYGLTEAGIPVTVNDCSDFKHGSIGKPFCGADVKIGENGEILVKTIGMMAGYFNDEELTKAAFTDDGYLKTGDIGYFDEHGSLFIGGRIKESIILSNGKKASPNDIEAFYKDIENIKEFTVLGVPEKNGSYDKIIGVFVIKDKEKLEETYNHIKEITSKLPQHLKMNIVKWIDELPKTNIGKPKRVMLRDLILANKI